MSMKRFIAALALLLSFSAPSYAIAIIAGTDTGGALGHGFSSGSTTVALTTTATVPSGSLIVVMCAGGNLTITAASDSAGNTYTGVLATSYLSPRAVREFYSFSTNSLASGSTITCTTNSSSGQKTVVAAAFSGLSATPLDAASVNQNGTSTTYTTGPTGTLAYPGGTNGEVLLGVVQPGISIAPSNDASFVNLGTYSNGSGTQAPTAFGYKIVSSSTPITYAPSGSSAAYVGQLGAFIGNGTSATTFHGLSSIGAGK